MKREELLRWGRVLEERRRWLAERGISYLLVLVPNKHRMYAQYMPPGLQDEVALAIDAKLGRKPM